MNIIRNAKLIIYTVMHINKEPEIFNEFSDKSIRDSAKESHRLEDANTVNLNVSTEEPEIFNEFCEKGIKDFTNSTKGN